MPPAPQPPRVPPRAPASEPQPPGATAPIAPCRAHVPAAKRWQAAALLVAITLLAWAPALRNGFIWDDDQYVTANRELRTPGGLAEIWLTPGAEGHSYGQYYPLVHTSFWIEHGLWGLQPLGYHAVNVALHALAALLLWRLLVRLDVPGAWLAAAVFALHPVHVETVAWITERKNVLSAVLYLGAAGCYLAFAGVFPRRASRGALYAAAFALYLGALLSKTVTCTLPAALLLVLAWKRGTRVRLGWRDAAPLVPFVAAGLGLGLLTAWIERTRLGASGPEWDLGAIERCLVAARALCFYAGKLAWPQGLTFIYPRWVIDAGSARQWVFVAACVGVAAALWRLRPRWGAGPLVAALFFAVTLAPALGFVNVYPMRFSFVADHFQYLASIGPIALLAGAAATHVARGRPALRIALASALLAVLGTLTWGQLPAYANQESLWLDTLSRNPACWMARNNLGMQRLQAGRVDEAIADFQAALVLHPRHEKAHSNLGTAELQRGNVGQAIAHYEAALALQPRYPEALNNLAIALGRAGRTGEAIARLREAINQAPRYAEARYNLALALLVDGQLEASIEQSEQVLALEPGHAHAHHNLANALVQAGRVPEAIAHYEEALRLDPGHALARVHLQRSRALLGGAAR
jgi:protein O-mannosyl-transferase